MSGVANIQYIPHQQIDKKKWDNCIATGDNGLIYGYSFYLDAMTTQWDALVLNDYETVMPLTWKKKYGISYMYQPFLTAQLGVFGKNITKEQLETFIDLIPSHFKFVEINLNSGNALAIPAGFFSVRSNYILKLDKSYKDIYQNYRENIQRNIKKAIQLGCTIEKDFDAEKVIELAVQQMKSQGQETAENIERFRNLYQHLHDRQMAMTYGISLKNELLASCIFFFSHQRAYYILVGNSPNGKTIGASHMLIDAFIKDYSGKNIVLDFEGSDIPSLAFFYSSFGAVHETYPALKINRLPFYLKWMKK
ncbi:MAG: GNAT family N-acetyltransferase [Chitinophagaceae bacterium]|nr:GNAT family N-acetyltransferase [Chitinophagaceae bacterium]